MQFQSTQQYIYQSLCQQFCQHGWLLTKQREMIFRALANKGFVDNIEEFWLELRQDNRISWAAVHNNVTQLIRCGILELQYLDDGEKRYVVVG